MPAAAVPIASSFLAPALADAAGTALAGTALGSLATSAPWLLPAITGAGLGGIGSLITGTDPLRGALLGGVGGGIGSQINGGRGLGSLFGGDGVNPSLDSTAGALSGGLENAPNLDLSLGNAGTGAGASSLYPASAASQFGGGLSSGLPSSGAAATAAASGSPSLLSRFLPYAAIGGGAMLLDQSMTPKQIGPSAQKSPSNPGPVAALNRQSQSVDPNSYYTSGGNRNYYSPYTLQPQFMAKGGPIGIGGVIANSRNKNPTPYPVKGRKAGVLRYYADGGSSSASSSNIPAMKPRGMVKGGGTGQSDSIPAMLSDGEFVVSAPVVSALGGGSNDAGAKKLSMMQKNVIKKHYGAGKPRKAAGLGSYMN